MTKGYYSIYTLIIVLFSLNAHAQNHESVLEGQTGQTLLTNLVNDFKTNTVLSYGPARDELYANVYRINGAVHCVYSDWAISLPDGVDPSQHLYQDGQGINAEHNYPKSKGATQGTNAYSDMHNIFPTRADINTDRGHLPFNNVNDSSTDTWYIQNQQVSGIPSNNIDLYSELGNSSFEPREAHKGNVARAIFYFYTMYQPQADAADNTFFPSMQEDLCHWHIEDPVDELEWDRTHLIAPYQEGKRNPFVLDCSLSVRAYCDQWIDVSSCPIVDANDEIGGLNNSIKMYPNPVDRLLNLELNNVTSKEITLRIYNDLGQNIYTSTLAIDGQNTTNSIDVSKLAAGVYFIQLSDSKTTTVKKFVKR